MRYHCTPDRIAKTKKNDNPNADKDVKQLELSAAIGEVCTGTALLENSVAVYTKLNILLPSMSTLGIYLREMNVYITKDFPK